MSFAELFYDAFLEKSRDALRKAVSEMPDCLREELVQREDLNESLVVLYLVRGGTLGGWLERFVVLNHIQWSSVLPSDVVAAVPILLQRHKAHKQFLKKVLVDIYLHFPKAYAKLDKALSGWEAELVRQVRKEVE